MLCKCDNKLSKGDNKCYFVKRFLMIFNENNLFLFIILKNGGKIKRQRGRAVGFRVKIGEKSARKPASAAVDALRRRRSVVGCAMTRGISKIGFYTRRPQLLLILPNIRRVCRVG